MKNRYWSLAVVLLAQTAWADPWDAPEYLDRTVQISPTNYWWFYQPSNQGEWDYFTPVSQPQEPVPVVKRYKLLYDSHYPFNGIQGYNSASVFVKPSNSRMTR